MLKKLWRLIVEFFIRLASRFGLKTTASSHHRESMIEHWRDRDSRHSSSAKTLASGAASGAALALPAGATMFDLAPLAKEQARSNSSDFGKIIEVDYVEGEFVSKSLHARTTATKSPWALVSFAAILVAALAFAGLRNFQQIETARTGLPDSVAAHDAPKSDAPKSDVAAAPAATAMVAPAPLPQQTPALATTAAPSLNAAQPILSRPNPETKGSVRVTTEAAPQSDARAVASAASLAIAPAQSVVVDKPVQRSNKVSAANDEGVSTAPKYTPPARARHERARTARAGRASSGGVSDTVVNGMLGGLAGAVVGGPVGLVAGAAVGATAGKAIAHSWGLR